MVIVLKISWSIFTEFCVRAQCNNIVMIHQGIKGVNIDPIMIQCESYNIIDIINRFLGVISSISRFTRDLKMINIFSKRCISYYEIIQVFSRRNRYERSAVCPYTKNFNRN